jgi:hypothetical protein
MLAICVLHAVPQGLHIAQDVNPPVMCWFRGQNYQLLASDWPCMINSATNAWASQQVRQQCMHCTTGLHVASALFVCYLLPE